MYKQFTRMFKDTQQKYENFEKSDEKRIKEIWAMHDQEARSLVQKIMHADRVIHVQQLQIDWEPPKDRFFQFLTESNAGGGQSDSNTQGNSLMNQNTSMMDSQGGG